MLNRLKNSLDDFKNRLEAIAPITKDKDGNPLVIVKYSQVQEIASIVLPYEIIYDSSMASDEKTFVSFTKEELNELLSEHKPIIAAYKSIVIEMFGEEQYEKNRGIVIDAYYDSRAIN